MSNLRISRGQMAATGAMIVALLTMSGCGCTLTPAAPAPAPVAAAAPPPPPPPPMQQKIVLRGVHFDFNMWNIRPGDAAVLDEAVPTLKTNPGVMIHVNGYCDAIGKPEPNLKLSAARAGSVTDYLMRQGLYPSQFLPRGYGKTDFVAPNKNRNGSDNPEGRAENRRVELLPIQ